MDISEFPQIKMLLEGKELSESELNRLRLAIRPSKLIHLIMNEKNDRKNKQLRKLLSVLHPNQKQYRWKRPRRTGSVSPTNMMSRFKKEDQIKTIVSGGGANSTGKRK